MSLVARESIIRPSIFLFILVLGISFSGCSLSHEVRKVSTIDHDEILVHRFPHAVVVSFSDQFDTTEVNLYPDDESTAINLGKKLKISLFEAVRLAYDDVYLARDHRNGEDVTRIIQFSIVESHVVYADDLIRSDAEDQSLSSLRLMVFAAAVSVEAYGIHYHLPKKKTVVRASSRFFRNSKLKKEISEFKQAVNMVIQRIAYDVANLLLQGYAEPDQGPNSTHFE